MMYRSKKVQTVEAVQWTGINIKAVKTFAYPTHVYQFTDNLTIMGVAGPEYMNVGDYLVKVKGNLTTRGKKEFEDKWEKCYEG